MRRQCRHGASSVATSACAGNPKTGARRVARTALATSVGMATMRMGSIICSSHPFSDSERHAQALDVRNCGAKSLAVLSVLGVQIRRHCDKHDLRGTKGLMLGLHNDSSGTEWRSSPFAIAKKTHSEGAHPLKIDRGWAPPSRLRVLHRMVGVLTPSVLLRLVSVRRPCLLSLWASRWQPPSLPSGARNRPPQWPLLPADC